MFKYILNLSNQPDQPYTYLFMVTLQFLFSFVTLYFCKKAMPGAELDRGRTAHQCHWNLKRKSISSQSICT